MPKKIKEKRLKYEELFYATKNKYKIQNMKDRLKDYKIELITPYDIQISIDVNEDGNTVIENAILKTKAYFEKVKIQQLLETPLCL